MTQETFTMHFVCSKIDRPFTIWFERENKNEIFTISKIERLLKSLPTVKKTKNSFIEVRDDEIDLNGFYCPCCGHNKDNSEALLFATCNRCNENICGCKSGRIRFKCRPSCGNKAFLSFSGSLASHLGSLQKTPALLSADTPPSLQLTHSGKTGNALIPRD